MTLKEFDHIRQYLPEDTEVTIIDRQPKKYTLEIIDMGNHDGRFNLHYRNCGYFSKDIPGAIRQEMEHNLEVVPMSCPHCGELYYKEKNKK